MTQATTWLTNTCFVAQRTTPKATSTRSVDEQSDIDDELMTVRQCIRTGDWSGKNCTRYLSVKDELAVLGKLVLRGTRLVMPLSLRKKAIELAHEGHQGMTGTKARLRTKV